LGGEEEMQGRRMAVGDHDTGLAFKTVGDVIANTHPKKHARAHTHTNRRSIAHVGALRSPRAVPSKILRCWWVDTTCLLRQYRRQWCGGSGVRRQRWRGGSNGDYDSNSGNDNGGGAHRESGQGPWGNRRRNDHDGVWW